MRCEKVFFQKDAMKNIETLLRSNSILSAHGKPETDKAIALLYRLSLHLISLIFAKLPIIGIHPSVDVYAFVDVESMHVPSPGISLLLKEGF